MECQDVPLAKIVVPGSHRKVKPAAVSALAASILEIGLQNPIGLVKNGHDYRLIHGRHRLEAVRSLGRPKITACIFEADELRNELAALDENLVRHNLNKIEEAKALKRRKEIYLSLHPETKAGTAGGKAGGRGRPGIAVAESATAISFVTDTATKTGKAERTVREDVAIGEAVTDEAAEIIADTPIADNKSELKALGELPHEEQVKVAVAVRDGTRKSVRKTEEPSFCKDLDSLIQRHHGKHKTPWCIIVSVLKHKLEWAEEQED
jgi:ParB family chromosome partitioning protein